MSDTTHVIIDFHVLSIYDPKILIVIDNSKWLDIEAEEAIIEIVFPGSTKSITRTFIKNSANTFNSNDLLAGCEHEPCTDCNDLVYVDLPDGVYTITVKGTPDTFQATKYHLKTDRFQMKLDDILTQIGFDYHIDKAEDRKKINEVEFLMKVANAHIRREDVGKAKKFFDLAVNRLDKLEKCFN